MTMHRRLWLVLGGLALLLMPGPAAQIQAQEAADTVRYSVTYVSVRPSARMPAITAVRQYRDASRKEDGYGRIEVFEQAGPPGHFAIVETWRDQQAFDAHASAAHTKQFKDTLQPIRITGYDERPYKTFTMAAAAGMPTGDAVHVVSHVDTIGGEKGGGPDLVRKMAEASRRERGSLRYDVLQGMTRANHFTVVETWANQAAYDAHAAAPHTKQYREAMVPVTGSPLDERIYKAVE
jgi:quinol monooxygenase YgiN